MEKRIEKDQDERGRERWRDRKTEGRDSKEVERERDSEIQKDILRGK